MKKYLYLPVAAMMLLTACGNDSDAPSAENAPLSPINLSSRSQDVLDAYGAFSFRLYNGVITKSDANEAFSPLSAAVNLSMLANGAGANARNEILDVIAPASDIADLNTLNAELLPRLIEVDPNCQVKIANGFWYRTPADPSAEFLALLQSNYMADVNDYTNGVLHESVNEWISKKTGGKISGVMNPGEQGPEFYAVNALYFNGKWAKAFKKENTRNGYFKTADGSEVVVPMMAEEQMGAYIENDVCSYITMKYGSSNYQMVLLLPNQGKCLDDLKMWLASTTPAEIFNKEMLSRAYTNIKVKVPRFEIAQREYDLIPALTGFGIKEIFDVEGSAFQAIVPTAASGVHKMRQYGTVSVNESGTEAASVTASSGYGTAPNFPATFHCIRPFMFMIRETTTGAILYMGQVVNPKK